MRFPLMVAKTLRETWPKEWPVFFRISATDWTEYEINLSQFVGDYQIAFVRNTTGGYYLDIDDLSISALPASAF